MPNRIVPCIVNKPKNSCEIIIKKCFGEFSKIRIGELFSSSKKLSQYNLRSLDDPLCYSLVIRL